MEQICSMGICWQLFQKYNWPT